MRNRQAHNFKLTKGGVERQFPREVVFMASRNIKTFNFSSNLRNANQNNGMHFSPIELQGL